MVKKSITLLLLLCSVIGLCSCKNDTPVVPTLEKNTEIITNIGEINPEDWTKRSIIENMAKTVALPTKSAKLQPILIKEFSVYKKVGENVYSINVNKNGAFIMTGISPIDVVSGKETPLRLSIFDQNFNLHTIVFDCKADSDLFNENTAPTYNNGNWRGLYDQGRKRFTVGYNLPNTNYSFEGYFNEPFNFSNDAIGYKEIFDTCVNNIKIEKLESNVGRVDLSEVKIHSTYSNLGIGTVEKTSFPVANKFQLHKNNETDACLKIRTDSSYLAPLKITSWDVVQSAVPVWIPGYTSSQNATEPYLCNQLSYQSDNVSFVLREYNLPDYIEQQSTPDKRLNLVKFEASNDWTVADHPYVSFFKDIYVIVDASSNAACGVVIEENNCIYEITSKTTDGAIDNMDVNNYVDYVFYKLFAID